jgi:hypothetical protein
VTRYHLAEPPRTKSSLRSDAARTDATTVASKRGHLARSSLCWTHMDLLQSHDARKHGAEHCCSASALSCPAAAP